MKEDHYFDLLMRSLLQRFKRSRELLAQRGTLAICKLCTLLGAEKTYRQLSLILEREEDGEFASVMVQALSLILLTSEELKPTRQLLQASPTEAGGRELFGTLYLSFCHAPVAVLSLCLLVQAYSHASALVQVLAEETTIELLIQMDRLVHLLESPVFATLRLQLLQPKLFPELLHTLYGLLMLLPQTDAFNKLSRRLSAVPTGVFLTLEDKSKASTRSHSEEKWLYPYFPRETMLQDFRAMQVRRAAAPAAPSTPAALAPNASDSASTPSATADR